MPNKYYKYWEKFFPDRRVVSIHRIHFILAGNAQLETHLAGISRLGADEVVVFANPANAILNQLKQSLAEMGVEYRIREIVGGYYDSFVKASEEAVSSLVEDCAIAVNMSTEQSSESSAIEDATRVQVYFFHRRNDKAVCSGYRYFVKPGRPVKLDIAPFWNFHNQSHNDMLEILSTVDASIGVTELWEMIKDTKEKENVEGFEAFRKIFRDFRRWLKNTPCFTEQMQKGPKYKIELK